MTSWFSITFVSKNFVDFIATHIACPSPCPISECSLDGRTRMQSSEHADRGNRCARKLGCDVLSDGGKTEDVDVQHLTGAPHRFEILAAEAPQAEIQTFSGRGLLDDIGVTFELVADCGSNEIGAVRVEPFADHQVDVTEIDIAEIDRDFFAVGGLWPELANIAGHDVLPSYFHLFGWYMDGKASCQDQPSGQA